MKEHFYGALTVGLIIGAAASIMMIPQMDYRTRRRVDKTSRRLVHRAGSFINDLRDNSK